MILDLSRRLEAIHFIALITNSQFTVSDCYYRDFSMSLMALFRLVRFAMCHHEDTILAAVLRSSPPRESESRHSHVRVAGTVQSANNAFLGDIRLFQELSIVGIDVLYRAVIRAAV